MEKPQRGPSLSRPGERASVEHEWLVAQLADEAEYWRTRAQVFETLLDGLATEVEAVHRRANIVEANRTGLSAELLEGSGFALEEAPNFRAAALILVASLVGWGLVALLAFVAYRLVA